MLQSSTIKNWVQNPLFKIAHSTAWRKHLQDITSSLPTLHTSRKGFEIEFNKGQLGPLLRRGLCIL